MDEMNEGLPKSFSIEVKPPEMCSRVIFDKYIAVSCYGRNRLHV